MPATYSDHRTNTNTVLFIAFELGWTNWRLAFGTGIGEKTWQKTIPARDLVALTREIKRARKKFGLPDEASGVSCYEAGRDGFWLHRYLSHADVCNHVVDSSSIEVNRRQRRAKSDRLDAAKLLTMLIETPEISER